MGTVNAKVPDQNMESHESGFSEQTEDKDIKKVPAKVQRVIIDGLGRTKNDIVEKAVKPIFSSQTFADMVNSSSRAKKRLQKLGLFTQIDIEVDTSKAKSASEDGYDVIFHVKEPTYPMKGKIGTEFGDSEGHLVFRLQLPNIFGRGEEVNGYYSQNLKTNQEYGFSFQKPLNGDPDIRLGASVYKGIVEFPWSSFKETSRGTSINLTFPSIFGSHCLKWEGIWRDMRSLNKTTSFAVREQAGHTLKSSIQHVFTRDNRDDKILPNRGTFFKLTQEYAGIGGNVEFIKNDAELQYNLPLVLDSVLQLSLAGGVLTKIDQNKEIKINDKFFLGGPLTLRGFNTNGVGPHADGNALGADAYWLSGLHLYTPLPFRPGKGGFGELFRSHFFVTAGNLGNIDSSRTLQENFKNLSETLRLSYGLGIVLRMGGIARLEVNYVVPVKYQSTDGVDRGFQFGIGLSFL